MYKLLIADNFLTGVFGEFCSLKRTWSLCLGALDLIISVPIWELKRTLLSWCFYILKWLSLSEQWCQERGYVCCDLWHGKWSSAVQDCAGFCGRPVALLLDSSWSWKRRVSSANLWRANLFFSYLVLCDLCFNFFLCWWGLMSLFDLLFFF